jgi:tetratricopeptide (TPR) repeat protein
VKEKAMYISIMGGVLEGIGTNPILQNSDNSLMSYSTAAYVLGTGIIVLSVFIVRLMVKYYNRMHYATGLNVGKEMGKEEIIMEQEEERAEIELGEDEKTDIDYDMEIDDIDKYTESLGEEDKDQPIIQNINKFVTGYKFLKPPDVAVLSLTKRFDEYEVAISLPEERKGASKISEFIPFDDKTRKEIQDEFDATAQLNNSMIGMPEMGGMGPIISSRLDGLGKRISATFIPENVMRNLQEIEDPIIIESNDGEILWETIHDGSNFIALEHPIGRVLKTKEEARVNEFERGAKLKFLMVCNPTGDLESTEREVNYIESILKQKVIIEKLVNENATRENIIGALKSGTYDVVHYAGHADSESEGEAALLAADGKLFSSEIKTALNGRPYVYLNACGSGRESMDESKDAKQVSDTEGLASAFILGGAIGFMGAFWPVPDKNAAEFSVKFYEGLIENLKVGEACRQARLELQKQNQFDITWAAFLQYGDPVQRLREKKKEKEEEVESEEDVDEDAEIEVVDEEEYEKTLEEEGEQDEEITEFEEIEEEEEEEEISEEELLKQYQGWIVGGLEHMKNKKYEDAITAFDSAIGLLPEKYNAWHLTGNALRELRRYNESLECYDKAIERDATIDEVWYDKALALGAVGRFDEALVAKQTSESLQVGRIKEWLRKANELMAHGGTRDAIKIYERILKENDKYPLAWYLKGIAHSEIDENDEAIQCYDNSLRYARKFSQGYHKKSELLFQLDRNDEALENINKALELNPINEEALILKSLIMVELQNYKLALKTTNQILKINNGNADALQLKADILRQYNKKKEALECYDKIIRLNIENQEAWFRRSQLINELGLDENDELECYRTLLSLDIENPQILIDIGKTFEQKAELYDEKLKWYNKMITYNPNDTFAWLNKGIALEHLGKTDDAIEAYNKVLELNKKNKTALLSLAKLHQQKAEDDLAEKYYKRVLKLDPMHSEALMKFSILNRAMGKNRDALNGFMKLYKLEHDNIEVLTQLRDINIELDRKKNAMIFSKKLLSVQPDKIENQYAHVKLLHQFRNYPEVILFTEKLLETDPDNLDVLVMRAEAFSNMQKLDKAVLCWDRIIELRSEANSESDSEAKENMNNS